VCRKERKRGKDREKERERKREKEIRRRSRDVSSASALLSMYVLGVPKVLTLLKVYGRLRRVRTFGTPCILDDDHV
jgi:hypothetical protein